MNSSPTKTTPSLSANDSPQHLSNSNIISWVMRLIFYHRAPYLKVLLPIREQARLFQKLQYSSNSEMEKEKSHDGWHRSRTLAVSPCSVCECPPSPGRVRRDCSRRESNYYKFIASLN
ncbi:hypothetical protein RRG08_060210 [Elysia crispata]|uniref:Uncharacterized protein n=1 Tax=Elysia crispata TaxID=231223 RepID=A0AAE0YLA1_9GAST|nr:hypothetical protein RRG08_060210 [Elysia crispata]